jgi:hypothetical protein
MPGADRLGAVEDLEQGGDEQEGDGERDDRRVGRIGRIEEQGDEPMREWRA